MTSPSSTEPTVGNAKRPLSRAPLARVLCQIRWNQLSRFELDKVADQVAQIIGDDYPLRDAQQEMEFVVSPSGVSQQTVGTIHRFQTADRTWTVSLGQQFLAVDTTAYEGHEDFVTRLESTVSALTRTATIPFLTRVGYRYVNHLTETTAVESLRELFVEGVLGGLAQGDARELRRTVSESVYSADGSNFLLVRSALLEPRMILEPTLPPVDGKSWVLDLDSYREDTNGFPVEGIAQLATDLSARAAKHFWSVITDEFVRRFE